LKSVNIIGAGNVAHFFGYKLNDEGYKIRCIYNRTLEKANALAMLCGSMATNDIISLPKTDITIIAITDDHVGRIAEEVYRIHGHSLPLIHTSGALSLDVFLMYELQQVGVIWPLQSIILGQISGLENVPLCIDARNDTFKKEIEKICIDISDNVAYMPSSQKKHAHVAAVIANNFTNHLLAIAESYCQEHGIDFNLLKPLIIQSIQKIETDSPRDIQTGPARRMDLHTINDQMDLIEDKDLKKIYRTISKSIIKTYHENN